jgi:hypothetical protein
VHRPEDCATLPASASARLNGAALALVGPLAQYNLDRWECTWGHAELALDQLPRDGEGLTFELTDGTTTWTVADPWFFAAQQLAPEEALPAQRLHAHFEPREATTATDVSWGLTRRGAGPALEDTGDNQGQGTVLADGRLEVTLPEAFSPVHDQTGASVPVEQLSLWLDASGLATGTCQGPANCVVRRSASAVVPLTR